MVAVNKSAKALSVNPLKASAPVGAALAFLGVARAIPILHGAQGCTAFGKIFFVQHYREPIPMQTTAMEQVSTVMGAQDNIVTGLATLCEKNAPDLIGLPTTALSEAQGSDVQLALQRFRQDYPDYAAIPVIPVSTPDFSGCFESGYAAAVEAIIDTLVAPAAVAGTRPGREPRQVNVLAGSLLTPGDVEALKALLQQFDLEPLVLPDLAESLDGHLIEADFSPLSIGGIKAAAIPTLGNSAATLVIGGSLEAAAERLQQRTGVPAYRFAHLHDLASNDRLIEVLAEIAGGAVPARLERQRSQLQDAMLDTHFHLGQARVGIAAEADLLVAMSQLLASVGAETVAAVAPDQAPALAEVATNQVTIGDLADFKALATAGQAELLVGNTHVADLAKQLDRPVLRAGFPQYDWFGGFDRVWIGYRGMRQTLYDLANALASLERGELEPYRSIYSQRPETAEASSCLQH